MEKIFIKLLGPKRFVLFVLVGLLPIYLFFSVESVLASCVGPTELVTVVYNKQAGAVYSYTVTNKHSRRIVGFSLGDSDESGIPIGIQIPRVVKSPVTWEGRLVYGHELPTMRINWYLIDPVNPSSKDLGIKTGDSVSGFVVEIPDPPSPFPVLYDDNEEIAKPLLVDELTFAVVFEDHTCAWGNATSAT